MSARGEETIILTDGGEVRVLYTNRAMADLESKMQMSVMEALDRFRSNRLSIGHFAMILLAGMQAAKRDVGERGALTIEAAYTVMDDVPFLKVAGPVFRAISAALTGENAPTAGGENEPKN